MSENIRKKYQALNADLKDKFDSGNLGELTPNDLRSVIAIGKELLSKHVAKTFLENVADYFRGFGFMVTTDFDKISYVIVEV